MHMKPLRIEICGNIASGKTTLCSSLADTGCIAVEETFLQNPFISKFYEDPVRYSFETEISFVLQHYHSIKTINSSSPLVCDYSFVLDKAYADVTLATDRRNIFFSIADEIELEIGTPELLIHLQCPEEVLVERIRKRGRRFESSISVDYLKTLTMAIESRVAAAKEIATIVTINSHAVDFTEGVKEIDSLSKALRAITNQH